MKVLIAGIAAVLLLAAASVAAQAPVSAQPQLVVPDAARPGPGFDVGRATRAWLDTLPADARAKSDAYFEGGYWLRLWGFLYTLACIALLLYGGLSARMRAAAERRVRGRWLRALLYSAGLIVLLTLLALPLTLYQNWWREHAYGLSNLSLGAFLIERAKGLALAVLLGAPLLATIVVAAQRSAGRWWLPATAISVVFLLFVNFIAPVFIAPLFNRFQPLPASPVRDAVLSMAHANGVSADNVYWFDASKQTSRISANVSGLAHTTRISLNDNLLNRTSLPEIKAVMAHELGHYVLNHALKLALQMGLVLAAGFAFTQWAQSRLVARHGARWGLRGPDDMAALPLVFALLTAWFFVMTPVTNSIVRTAEMEADIYGLNAGREPHGFASTAMRLSTYRKLEPSPLEEIVFFDHPSGLTRVRAAMTWFAENPTAGAAGQAPR